MTTRAVLTGDLVGSSRLSPASLEGARGAFATAATEIETWRTKLVGAPADFFRGDSWQMLLTQPGFALRAALYIRASLKAGAPEWDTRIAIGYGEVDRIDKQRTSLSSGEAFLLSGRALDDLGDTVDITVRGPRDGLKWDALGPLAHLCSVLMDDWSQKQAQAARLALAPDAPTQARMAELLGVSQQAVSKALSAAKITALLRAIDHSEALTWNRVRLI